MVYIPIYNGKSRQRIFESGWYRNLWMLYFMENPPMDDLGVALIQETSIWEWAGNESMYSQCTVNVQFPV